MGKLNIAKVKKMIEGKSGSIAKGIDSAVDKIDKQTKGKYRDKLTKGAEGAKTAVTKLDAQATTDADVQDADAQRDDTEDAASDRTSDG